MKTRSFLSSVILPLALACAPEAEPEIPVEVLPPSGVRLVQADETSLTFSWTAVEGAEEYTARLEEPILRLFPAWRKIWNISSRLGSGQGTESPVIPTRSKPYQVSQSPIRNRILMSRLKVMNVS